MSKNSFTSGLKSGFTLFELLVSVSIIVLVSGIVFLNHSKFKSDTEITNLAYRMALSIREAQVYSISVRQFDLPGLQNFDTPYGIHFKQSKKDSFILFADGGDGQGGPNDGLYSNDKGVDTDCDTEEGTECIEKTTIGRNNLIKGWCGILWNGIPAEQPCFSSDDPDDYYLDITFKRPNPDAIFRVYESTYKIESEMGDICKGDTGFVTCTGWAVCLVAPDGRQRQVVVYETGQISVQNVDTGVNAGCNSIE